MISCKINSRVNARYEKCHNSLGVIIIQRVIVVMKGSKEERKRPRDTPVIATAAN